MNKAMSNPIPMNNDKHTLGKAVLNNRLGDIIRRMDHARDAYKTSHKTTKDAETGKTSLTVFQEDMAKIQESLEVLSRDLKANLVEETTLGREYNKETFDAALRVARQQVLEQFKNFPIAAALLECFLMYLETQLDLGAHFLNLRKIANVEDREGSNGRFYNLDGDPKNKG
jgi:hypothetical protein